MTFILIILTVSYGTGHIPSYTGNYDTLEVCQSVGKQLARKRNLTANDKYLCINSKTGEVIE